MSFIYLSIENLKQSREQIYCENVSLYSENGMNTATAVIEFFMTFSLSKLILQKLLYKKKSVFNVEIGQNSLVKYVLCDQKVGIAILRSFVGMYLTRLWSAVSTHFY